MKFDPSDQELLEHLEAKARSDSQKIHPLIDEFIPTLEGEDGICYTHPERLPGDVLQTTPCNHGQSMVLKCNYTMQELSFFFL